MQLNQTEITIRERSKRELFDLALHVTRRHCGVLLLTLVVGALPFAAFNAWALSGLAWDRDYREPQTTYILYLTLLAIIEAPLALALTTLYLGQVLFGARPSPRDLAREFRRSLPQVIWYFGLARGIFVAMAAAAFNRFGDRDGFLEFIIWCAAIWSVAVRCGRPYFLEVILLERNPRRARQAGGMTTSRRNAALHAGYSGDAIAQLIGAAILGGIGATSIWLTLSYLRAEFFNAVEFDRASITVLLPIALWLVAWFLAIVRFLGYLDLRIRREGWEVELRVRSEAVALARAAQF